MSIIDLSAAAINDVPEQELLPAGEEVEARLLNIITGDDKNGKAYFILFYEAVDHPNVAEFSDFIYSPLEPKLNEKEVRSAKLRFQDQGNAFDIDWNSPIDEDEIRGKTGFVIVGVKPARDGYEASNSVSKYVAGH